MGIEAPKLKIDFKKGDRVKVTSGPFFDFTGVIDEIQPEKERLRALISIFGRETPSRTRVLPSREGLSKIDKTFSPDRPRPGEIASGGRGVERERCVVKEKTNG